jgi:tripartite-type tricarboxylate transporter receptor subunit TctC
VVNRLNAALRQLIGTPQIQELLIAQGADPESDTPEEFAKFIRSEVTRTAMVVRAAGVKPEGAR